MGETPSVGISTGSDSDDVGIKNWANHKENIKKGFISKNMGHNSAKTLTYCSHRHSCYTKIWIYSR
jgi:hypothetical protein